MKIAIAGPGRSGTSVLVRLFGEWGFSVPATGWHPDAEAGLEARIGAGTPYEVDKDPWAYEYLDRLDEAALASYAALIVPIRSRQDAAISRSVQERFARARGSHVDLWRWDSYGWAPGGAVADSSMVGIAQTLAFGLWDLLEKASRVGLSIRILHFPKFANDFDYLWSQLAGLLDQRVTREEARRAWNDVVDPSLIRVVPDAVMEESAKVRELNGVIEMLRSELARARHEPGSSRA